MTQKYSTFLKTRIWLFCRFHEHVKIYHISDTQLIVTGRNLGFVHTYMLYEMVFQIIPQLNELDQKRLMQNKELYFQTLVRKNCHIVFGSHNLNASVLISQLVLYLFPNMSFFFSQTFRHRTFSSCLQLIIIMSDVTINHKLVLRQM